MKTAFLIGDKIYLRALQKSDAATCGEFINDPDVWRTLDTCRPKNLMAEEEWIAGQCGDPTTITLGIALKENDRLIGTTDLRAIHAINRCATFGLMVGAKDQWRNGHGTEATRMMVRVWLSNAESQPHRPARLRDQPARDARV